MRSSQRRCPSRPTTQHISTPCIGERYCGCAIIVLISVPTIQTRPQISNLRAKHLLIRLRLVLIFQFVPFQTTWRRNDIANIGRVAKFTELRIVHGADAAPSSGSGLHRSNIIGCFRSCLSCSTGRSMSLFVLSSRFIIVPSENCIKSFCYPSSTKEVKTFELPYYL